MTVACYNEFTFQSRSSRDEGISKSTFKYRKVTQFTAQIRKSIARIRKSIAQIRKSIARIRKTIEQSRKSSTLDLAVKST